MRLRRIGSLAIAIALLMPCAAAGSAMAMQQAGASATDPVDVNKAGIDELTRVPGIGQVMAQRIVDFRSENGPFRRLEDLLKVKGVGEKKLARLRPYLKVGRSG